MSDRTDFSKSEMMAAYAATGCRNCLMSLTMRTSRPGILFDRPYAREFEADMAAAVKDKLLSKKQAGEYLGLARLDLNQVDASKEEIDAARARREAYFDNFTASVAASAPAVESLAAKRRPTDVAMARYRRDFHGKAGWQDERLLEIVRLRDVSSNSIIGPDEARKYPSYVVVMPVTERFCEDHDIDVKPGSRRCVIMRVSDDRQFVRPEGEAVPVRDSSNPGKPRPVDIDIFANEELKLTYIGGDDKLYDVHGAYGRDLAADWVAYKQKSAHMDRTGRRLPDVVPGAPDAGGLGHEGP